MPLPHYYLAFSCQRLAGVFFQSGLGVEGVDVADAAAHEQGDYAFGARGEVRLFGRVRIEPDGLRIAGCVVDSGSQQAILIQEMRQSQAAEAAAGLE
jgi:hypothetical protein